MGEDYKWIKFNHRNGRDSLWRPKDWKMHRRLWRSWYAELYPDKKE
jgi:hypothetical protein